MLLSTPFRHYAKHDKLIKSKHTTTITFDPPFWIALFERMDNGMYAVAREVIGTSEPTNAELLLFLDKLDFKAIRYSAPTEDATAIKSKISFKKMQKKVQRATEQSNYKHTYSKAHEELKKQQEKMKLDKKSASKAEREEEKERKYELKQQKKKQKLKGR